MQKVKYKRSSNWLFHHTKDPFEIYAQCIQQNVQKCFFSIHMNPKHSQVQQKHLHAMDTQVAQREEKVNNVTQKIIGMEE